MNSRLVVGAELPEATLMHRKKILVVITIPIEHVEQVIPMAVYQL